MLQRSQSHDKLVGNPQANSTRRKSLPPPGQRNADRDEGEAAPLPKLRRSSPNLLFGKARAAAAQPVANRTLALRHPAPPTLDQEELDRLALAQFTREHLDFTIGANFQSKLLNGVSVSALLSTVGFAANLGDVGPWGCACSALAAVLAFGDVHQARVNAKLATQRYLAALVLLAEQQRVLADVERRERNGEARADDAALKILVPTLIASLEAGLSKHEAGYFRDAKSPLVQEVRSALDQRACRIVDLKAEHDQLGAEVHRLSAELWIPGLGEAQRAALTGRIERLRQAQAQLAKDAALARKDMKKELSPRHMKRRLKQRLARYEDPAQATRCAAPQGAVSVSRLRELRSACHGLRMRLLMPASPAAQTAETRAVMALLDELEDDSKADKVRRYALLLEPTSADNAADQTWARRSLINELRSGPSTEKAQAIRALLDESGAVAAETKTRALGVLIDEIGAEAPLDKRQQLSDWLERLDERDTGHQMPEGLDARLMAAVQAVTHGPDPDLADGEPTPVEQEAARTRAQLRALEEALVEADAELDAQQAALRREGQRQRDIQAVKKDLRHFSRRPDRLLANPFGFAGQAELNRLRDAVLNTCGNLIGIGAAANTASVVWHLAQPVFSSVNLLLPVWLLNFFVARIDIKGGNQDMAMAAAAKLPWLKTAAETAALYQQYAQDPRPLARAAQCQVRALTQRAGRELQFLHHFSGLGKTRKGNGLYTLLVGTGLVAGAIVLLATGIPIVIIPFALLGGLGGTAYARVAGQFVGRIYAKEHKSEQRQSAAALFVQHFGVEAIAQLQQDVADGKPEPWTTRLRSLRQQLPASTPGRQLLHPQTQAFDDWLSINYQEHCFLTLTRDPHNEAARIGAETVSRLAEARGLPDPGVLKLEAFPSLEAYAAHVRKCLKDIYALEPTVTDSPPFPSKRALRQAAARVSACLDLAGQKNLQGSRAKPGQPTLLSWVSEVAQAPEQFGALLAALSADERQQLRLQVANLRHLLHLNGIGPRQLLALQALSVAKAGEDQAHPLSQYVPLMQAHTAHLLELLAEPQWLDEPAPVPANAGQAPGPAPVQAHAPADPAPPGPPTGAELVPRLSHAHKLTGRQLRAGPAARRPRLPRGDGELAPGMLRRREPLAQRAADAITTAGRQVRKHFRQHRANPMATAAQTLQQLLKAPDEVQRQLLMQELLLNFVGGHDHVMPLEEQVMATLPADASDTDIRRAHLQAWLARARASASVTAQAIADMPSDKKRPAMERLQKSMADQAALCDYLSTELSKNRAWEPALKAIQVKALAAPVAVS